jgi:murein L,D-transpeptidase YcbB/YkuD
MIKRRSHPLRLLLPTTAMLVATLTLAACAMGPRSTMPPSGPSAVAEGASSIDVALRSALAQPGDELRDLRPQTLAFLQTYYSRNGHAPLWVGPRGLTARGAQLFAALAKARDAGAPTLPRIMPAAEQRRAATAVTARAELELLLSGALLDSAVSAADPTMAAPVDEPLQAATVPNPSSFLAERLPADPAFWALRNAVAAYRDVAAAGGWPTVPDGPKLERGTADARIPAVRARLAAAGELSGTDVSSPLYDAALRQAVEGFQARHGLARDGVIGPGTLEALNVPVGMRLATMTANLRRLQQQGRDWGRSYIAVNIAAAQYRLVKDGQTVFEQVAIVGQPEWKTPEVDSEIDRIELNPFWTVPPRIARLEVQPAIAKDPDYLAKNNMREVGGLYRQDPGPVNALGKAKFLFPNSYDVYLHDTNSPRLFTRDRRFLSHGCVRIPNAVELAGLLLQDDADWTREKIEQAIGRGKNRSITLARPVPVHLVYDTAWVDDSGAVQFRPDIYGRDAERLVAAAN